MKGVERCWPVCVKGYNYKERVEEEHKDVVCRCSIEDA